MTDDPQHADNQTAPRVPPARSGERDENAGFVSDVSAPAGPDAGLRSSAVAGENDPSQSPPVEPALVPLYQRPTKPRRPDPFAHRRGEPRVFAFLWTLYLLIAVAGGILWHAGGGEIGPGGYGAPARTVLVVMAAGVTVLWPMTRLSQAAPDVGLVRSCVADLAVVLAPVQLVLWPLALLAQWPLDAVAALALAFAGWGALVGGMIPFALVGSAGERPMNPEGPFSRAGWMLLVVTLSGAAPAVLALLRAAETDPPRWLACASLFTAVFSLTGRGWSGPGVPVHPQQWAALAAPMLLGIGLWTAAALRRAGGSRAAHRLH